MNYGHPTGYAIHCDIYCPDCADTVMNELNKGREEIGMPAYDFDGDDDGFFPIGVNGHETDSPCHCAFCGELIEGQTLTADGEEYVHDALEDYCRYRGGSTMILDQWHTLLVDCTRYDERHDGILSLYDTVRAIRGWRHDEGEDMQRSIDAYMQIPTKLHA